MQQLLRGADLGDGQGPADSSQRVWPRHPVDVRFTLPLPFGRYYLTLVAGPERRAPARASNERRRHPMLTLGNLLFFLVSALAVNVAAGLGLLIYSSVLRF